MAQISAVALLKGYMYIWIRKQVVRKRRQRIASLHVKVEQTSADINSYAEQYKVAQTKENMRRELEHMQVGSKLSTLDADAQRAEVQRALQAAFSAHKSAYACDEDAHRN